MKSTSLRFALLAAVFATGSLPARAEDLGVIRQRMETRLSYVDAAKADGEAGETNRGLLAARKIDERLEKLVADENADRRAVYAALARQTGSTVDAVGAARARQIAGASRAGVWLQKEDGTWYRK